MSVKDFHYLGGYKKWPTPADVEVGSILEDYIYRGEKLKKGLEMTPEEFVKRLLGGASSRFMVKVFEENWQNVVPTIMHIALLDVESKKIVRFEENPNKFPTDDLIEKLRLLR